MQDMKKTLKKFPPGTRIFSEDYKCPATVIAESKRDTDKEWVLIEWDATIVDKGFIARHSWRLDATSLKRHNLTKKDIHFNKTDRAYWLLRKSITILDRSVKSQIMDFMSKDTPFDADFNGKLSESLS